MNNSQSRMNFEDLVPLMGPRSSIRPTHNAQEPIFEENITKQETISRKEVLTANREIAQRLNQKLRQPLSRAHQPCFMAHHDAYRQLDPQTTQLHCALSSIQTKRTVRSKQLALYLHRYTYLKMSAE